MPDRPQSRSGLLVLASASAATAVVCLKLGVPATGIDDADIFLSYAKNLSAGHGFVFNAGGERVEGFTSLLWLLICTGVTAVVAAPERVLLVANVLLVSLTAVAGLRTPVLRRAEGEGLSRPWAYAFLFLLFSDYRYVAWSTVTLMETALWGCLLALSALIAGRGARDRKDDRLIAAVIALMVLTRPEALLYAPVLLIVHYVNRTWADGHRGALHAAAPGVAAFAVTAGLLTLFRVEYFGFPFPNTYYAKVSPSIAFRLSEGGKYFWGYVFSDPVPLATVCALAFSAIHLLRVRLRDTTALALTAVAGTGLAIPVLTGGDHFAGFRFYQSTYPVLLLVLFNTLRFIVPRYVAIPTGEILYQRRRFVYPFAAAMLGILAWQVVAWAEFDQRMPLREEFDIAEMGRRRGSDAGVLFDSIRPLPTIGTITVGGLKYAYPGEVVDLMGLNNTRMAHNGGTRIGLRSHAAFEIKTFYELKPTLVIPLVQFSDGLPWLAQRLRFVDVALKGLLDEPRFRAEYRLAEVRRKTGEGTVAVAAWYDRGFLNRLEGLSQFEVLVLPGR